MRSDYTIFAQKTQALEGCVLDNTYYHYKGTKADAFTKGDTLEKFQRAAQTAVQFAKHALAMGIPEKYFSIFLSKEAPGLTEEQRSTVVKTVLQQKYPH